MKTQACLSFAELIQLLGSDFSDLLMAVDRHSLEHGRDWFYNGALTVYLLPGLRVFAEAIERVANDTEPAANVDAEVARREQREKHALAAKTLRREIARLEQLAAEEEAARQPVPPRFVSHSKPVSAEAPWYRSGAME